MSTKKNIKEIMSKRYIQIGILIVLISLVCLMGTYAWFTWASPSNTNVTLSIGNLADVTFTSGPDINISNLAPVYNYTDGVSTTFVMKNNSTTNNLNYEIKLDVTSISNELKNESFKYTLLKDNKVVQTGNFKNAVNGKTLTLNTGLLAKGSTSNYKLYFWIDGNIENSSSMMNKSLVGKIDVGEKTTYINNLYNNSTKTPVTNNSITYQYDTTNNLMQDTAGNIRYYGASPNNYVYFNCDSYPSTNCELWRIIGVFDGKIKLIRNESIGNYSWDTSASSVNSGNGVNEWSQADLMKLLNPGYESNTDLNKSGTSITVNNSLYYNSGSGTCYSGIKNSTKSCDFTSIGIKNDTTRNMISDSTYYLGGGSSAEIYSNTALTMERGTNVVIPGTTCSGTYCNDTVTRTTSWTGKIGLMYPSDYGYATDFTKCSQNLYNYNNSTDSYACRTNDWLHNNITQWLLTPRSSYARDVWYVYSSGGVFDGNSVFLAFGVRPVLYLNSVLVIESGSGTESDPYRISA